MDEECEQFSNSKSSASGCCLASEILDILVSICLIFCQFKPGVAYKILNMAGFPVLERYKTF